jgi:hypothetical protein
MSIMIIGGAIQSRSVIQFYYNGGKAPGIRLVEPYMVAYNEAGNLCLSAWFLGGVSGSQEGHGWREYLMSEISSLSVLPRQFVPPRVGYNPTGGQKFYNVQCAV